MVAILIVKLGAKFMTQDIYEIVDFLYILIPGVIVNSSMALTGHKWLKNDLS